MRSRILGACLSAAMLVCVTFSASHATSVLISNGNNYQGYGYGGSEWGNFTAIVNSTFSTVATAPDFSNQAQVLAYDRLFLVPREPGGTLSPAEIANITDFVNTGRRVLLLGENDSWYGWNSQILGIVGGTYNFAYITGNTSAVVNNEITNGTSPLYLPAAGIVATGGIALYDQNFATLWAGFPNVLTVLDINVFDDTYGNPVFERNVANWLAGPVPEPGAIYLLGSGLAGLVFMRRARRTK